MVPANFSLNHVCFESFRPILSEKLNSPKISELQRKLNKSDKTLSIILFLMLIRAI